MVLKLPIYAFVDCSPRGIQILSYYGHGAKDRRLWNIKRIGLRLTDLDKYKILQLCKNPMTGLNTVACETMLKGNLVKEDPDGLENLNLMMEKKEKMEYGRLDPFDMFSLCDDYLSRKLSLYQVLKWLATSSLIILCFFIFYFIVVLKEFCLILGLNKMFVSY